MRVLFQLNANRKDPTSSILNFAADHESKFSLGVAASLSKHGVKSGHKFGLGRSREIRGGAFQWNQSARLRTGGKEQSWVERGTLEPIRDARSTERSQTVKTNDLERAKRPRMRSENKARQTTF